MSPFPALIGHAVRLGSQAMLRARDRGMYSAAQVQLRLVQDDLDETSRGAGTLISRAGPASRTVLDVTMAPMTAAVQYVARCGIRQYVDIGAGLPTSPNVHESARAVVPAARVAYVDNDRVAVTHARALLATDDQVIVIDADARKYEAILTDPRLGALIDLSEPVCVLFVSTLHFLSADEADAIVAAFRLRMAPGSYLVISAGHQENYRVQEQVQAAYGDTALTGRPAAQIAAYFDGFDLVPPGLVPVTEWPPDEPDAGKRPRIPHGSRAPMKASMLAGIGRKRG